MLDPAESRLLVIRYWPDLSLSPAIVIHRQMKALAGLNERIAILMTSHSGTVRRDTPVPGTHLTELELQEMWYQDHERIAAVCGTESHHRAHGRLFPRSRTDLIQYYTQLSLQSQEPSA